MNCPHCNATIDDNLTFCTNCGAPIPAADPAPETQKVFCVNCGYQVDSDVEVCPNCGSAPTAVPAKKKSKHIGLIAAIAAVCVIVAVLLAGFATNWFGLYGPGTQIAQAANKTFGSGNYTIDFTMTLDCNDPSYSINAEAEGSIQMILDPEARQLTLYAQVEVEGEKVDVAIYDERLICGASGQYFYLDISDALDEAFDSYESSKELDWEELLNSIQDGLYDEVSEDVNFDALDDCMIALGKKMNNTNWLKENAGYSCEKEDGVTVHHFEPKTYTLVSACAELFKPVFRDEDVFEEMMDSLKDSESEMNVFEMSLALGIKGGELVSTAMAFEYDVYAIEMDMEYSEIGTTKIDTDKLEDMLDNATDLSDLFSGYFDWDI